MEEIKKLLKEVLNREFIRAVISSPKEKEGTAVLLECGTEPVQGILKIKVRPLEKRGELLFQLEAFTKTQAFHRNLNPEAAGEILAVVMEPYLCPVSFCRHFLPIPLQDRLSLEFLPGQKWS